MHYPVAVIVDGNLPRAQASRLAAAAMRARHRFHCRAGGVLWDGFALLAVRRASETVGFESPLGFVTVSPDRPTSKRDPRWYEHPRDECTVFEYADEAGCDAAWQRWQTERPGDWVYVYDVHEWLA